MNDPPTIHSTLYGLNTLCGGLFLLTAFGMVAMRQARGCLNLFIAQSLFLAASAFVLGLEHHSYHLYGVALVNLISKPIIVPWLLRRTSRVEIYTRREVDQVLNIPSALLIALGLVVLSYFLAVPLLRAVTPEFRGPNVPIGIAGLLLGGYTLTVRREAVPLLLGLLAMENGAFFAGISISRDLPMLVELAIATDGLISVFIMGVLTRAVAQHIGTTAVGELASLKEAAAAPTQTKAEVTDERLASAARSPGGNGAGLSAAAAAVGADDNGCGVTDGPRVGDAARVADLSGS